jgi:hypothetical protein
LLETELGKDFFKWLIKAINSKTIAINTAQSKVHLADWSLNQDTCLPLASY